MKLLIIEDNETTVQGIIDEAREQAWDCKTVSFETAIEEIRAFSPDIIVLDWMYDVENADKGNTILNEIYNQLFIPTVIFSALERTITLSEDMQRNPLVKKIPKGDEQPVIDIIKSWNPYLKAIRDFKKDLNSALLSAIDVIDFFLSTEYPGDSIVEYMLNKRANYYFSQETVCKEDNPPAWIAYEYPPTEKSILAGDIIRTVPPDADYTKEGLAEEYYVVLTPSCDIARADPQKDILLASGSSSDQFLISANYVKYDLQQLSDEKKEKKANDLVKNYLNRGYNNSGEFILPHLPKKIPNLTVKLRDLKLVKLGCIALSDREIEGDTIYYRVASLDSPFREHIIWAYLQTACRPGLPDRDTRAWAKELLFGTEQ